MRSITVKLPDDIVARVEAEARLQRRDLAELAGERLAERYAAAPTYKPPHQRIRRPPRRPENLGVPHFDTTWAGANDAPKDESDAALLAEVQRFLGRETEGEPSLRSFIRSTRIRSSFTPAMGSQLMAWYPKTRYAHSRFS